MDQRTQTRGVIGIFPEGGIWEPAIRKAHSGVAFMSYHGQAPVLPIGFTPTAGALAEALSFKRPAVEMRIGKLIPSVTTRERTIQKGTISGSRPAYHGYCMGSCSQNKMTHIPPYEYEQFEFDGHATSPQIVHR